MSNVDTVTKHKWLNGETGTAMNGDIANVKKLKK